jgi:dolichol-phosphate mannosyltransferase
LEEVFALDTSLQCDFPSAVASWKTWPPSRTRRLACLVLAGMAAALFLGRLDLPLLEPEEARYAEIPRQMLAHGHFVEPVLHGEPYYHKPPLFYWLVMASYRLFGIHDWTARLVPAGAALLTVLVCFLWGRRTVGFTAAFLGCCVLILSPRFVYMARMHILDGVLCLCVTAALAAAHLGIQRQSLRWRYWILSALACGVGVMTKGPVSLVLVVVPLLLCRFIAANGAKPSVVAWTVYGLVSLGVAAPWYTAIALRNPAAFTDFFWLHNVQRFTEPFDHAKPFWYYLPHFLLGTLPWSILLPAVTLVGIRDRRRELVFPVLACCWCLVFFSLSGCKRPAYILPAFPPFALALGSCLARTEPWNRRLLQPQCNIDLTGSRLPRQVLVVILLMVLTLLAVAIAAGYCAIDSGGWTALIVILVSSAVLCWTRSRPRVAWGACIAGAFVLMLAAAQLLLPEYHRRFSLRDELAALRHRAAHRSIAVVCYPRRWDSVSFYWQRDDIASTGIPAAHTLAIVKSSRFTEWLANLPPTADFTLLTRSKALCIGILRARKAESSETAAPTGDWW